jgi:hypothetical protein
MENAAVARLLDILYDLQFVWLRVQSDRAAIRWSDFKKMMMPQKLSPTQTWQILTAIRRQTAIIWPVRTYFEIKPNVDLWHTDTQRILSMQSEIDSRCRSNSLLYIALGKISKYSLRTQTVQDISAACKRDGIDVTPNSITNLLDGKRNRESPEDILILRTTNLLDNLDKYARRRISPGLIEEFYYRLTENTDPLDLGLPLQRYKVANDHPYSDPDVCVDTICKLSEDVLSDTPIHPIIKAMCIWSLLWDVRPFPFCNALMEIVLRRFIFKRSDYPVLCWIPFSNIVFEWDLHQTGTGQGQTNVFEIDAHTGVDCTSSVEDIFAIILEGLSQLERLITDSELSERQLLDRLTAYHKLNFRQKHVLKRVMEAPRRKLGIETHRKFYGVSYATARNDLLDLVAMGYLQQHKFGHAFVFTIHPLILQEIYQASIE